MTWKREKTRGEKIEGSWITNERIEHDDEWRFTSRYAGYRAGDPLPSSTRVEIREHRSGSGPGYFGFESHEDARWPVVKAEVPLPAREGKDRADRVAAKLRDAIEKILQEEGLLP